MKPAWDKLMDEFAGSKTSLVADVDCTAAGKPLCDKHGVQGFPTIKYGDPNNMEKYEGGRDFDALSTFAKENLGPTCGPAHMELCDESQKAEIEKIQAMPDAELDASIAEKEKTIADAEAKFKAGVEELQSTHKKLQEAKDSAIAVVKKSGLATLKVVKGYAHLLKCKVSDPSTCSEKEQKFITTMKAKDKDAWEKQVVRLTKMSAGDMKAELKDWIWQRLRILRQMQNA
jgi:hypothetical protein